MKTILLAGTIPDQNLSLALGTASLCGTSLSIDGRSYPVNRGTAAMIGAVCATAGFFGDSPPECVVGGDIGTREGSREVYRHLIKHLPRISADTLCLHYIIPDIGLHNQVLTAVRKMHVKPVVIADAGFMYAAKASGQARFYDLFLPDIGELAFLADEKASHPAYTRGFLTRLEIEPKELIGKAYEFGMTGRCMCVKGRTDYICQDGVILEQIDDPVIEELEPIGGTGDTITGMTAGLVHHGYMPAHACALACRANRIAGLFARPTPATQIHEIIARIPEALSHVISGHEVAAAYQQEFFFEGVQQ
ncbi:MAG: sugar kinase [Deltaproteobacteria bacterium]|nr:sugar kinase [Deltaproteobacteria bacterium]